jgi:hypothetical protein
MADSSRDQEQEQEKDGHVLADLVKLAVLAWSMAILTANYLGFFKQALDPTFPASLLTGTLSAMGVNVRQNRKKEEPKLKQQDASK